MPFQPGVSGNPGGRPKSHGDLMDVLRSQIPYEKIALALDKLVDGGDPKTVIYMADRHLGKPPQQVLISGDVERPLHALVGVVARDLTPLAPQDAPEALPAPEAHCLDDLDD